MSKASRIPAPVIGVERLLALDVSSKCVGWAIFDDGYLVGAGKYVVVGDGHGEKLTKFREWLLGVLDRALPTCVAYEAPYAGRNRRTYGVLSRYVGVVDQTYYEVTHTELPVDCAIPAHAVKRAIRAPKGKSYEDNKRAVLKLVNSKFRLRLRYKRKSQKGRILGDDDIADAIAVGWAWYTLHDQGVADV